MSNKMWDVLIEHARTCLPSGKLYVYYPDDVKNMGVVLNNIYELSGLIANGEYYSADSLSENQKVYVDSLVKMAYDNWLHVVEYDGKSLSEYQQDHGEVACEADVSTCQQNVLSSYDHQLPLHNLSNPVPSEQPVINSGPAVSGYSNDLASRYSVQSQNGSLSTPFQFDGTSLPPQDPLASTLEQTPFPRSDDLLALAPSQATTGFQDAGTSNLTSYRTTEDIFPEDEIRMRSHEMLENEDMQHLLRIFNMGGQGLSSNVTDDGYPHSSAYMPATPTQNYGFGDDPSRSSGKAVVGWLKLKAALRWGIFVRKRAAERRAQLIELDDS
uniref:Calmodulin-binding protein 60-C n=1 Tax=Rhizophora mucronata TaxID=61149 RepID=A0A2P2QQS0_RHIMU